MHHLYDVYGLTIGCDIAVPELLPSQGRSGIAEINVGLADPPNQLTTISDWLVSTASPSGAPWLSWAKVNHGYVLRFHDLADFLVDSEGCHVTCVFAASDVSAATLRHLVIDHVLPRVLNLRGFDALHATAVVIEDRVCAFVAKGRHRQVHARR